MLSNTNHLQAQLRNMKFSDIITYHPIVAEHNIPTSMGKRENLVVEKVGTPTEGILP